jgi:NADH-quinone oxidoreductase subunit J
MITFMQIAFFVTALIVLGSAILVVSSRKLIHSALWLILSLFGVAILFALLEAGFFSVVQVVIYIGAIAILVLFAIMLTRKAMEDVGPQVNRSFWLAAIVSIAVFGGLVWLLSGWQGFNTMAPELTSDAVSISALGQALVSPNGYMLPFEVASILLLAALVGAIYISWDKK